jgi:hypothetical protein
LDEISYSKLRTKAKEGPVELEMETKYKVVNILGNEAFKN